MVQGTPCCLTNKKKCIKVITFSFKVTMHRIVLLEPCSLITIIGKREGIEL